MIKSNFQKVKEKFKSKKFRLLVVAILAIGVLLIFSSYAWFNASLNVKVKFFNMIVSKNNGLYISFDGINYGSSIEISRDVLIDGLEKTYPNNVNQWAYWGLSPISSSGIRDNNSSKFDLFQSNSFGYHDWLKKARYLSTKLIREDEASDEKQFIAFDLFLKNITGSPVSDNLYLDEGTSITLNAKEESTEMPGLVNSIRFGFVRIGSVPLNTNYQDVQNIMCNNNCEMVIYEPNDRLHSLLSIERAKDYNVRLVDGEYFPTYSIYKEGSDINIRDTIYGSNNLNTEYVTLQKTRTDFTKSLFEVPSGITKVRLYVWIEGQDIDSLETNSSGASISITINFVKDTAGYDYFD